MTPRGLKDPAEGESAAAVAEGEAQQPGRIPDPMLPEVGPDHPDAKLVDLWRQRNDMLWPVQLGEVEHTSEESDDFCEKLTELDERIATMPAATIVGMGIKARLLWEHGSHKRKATPWTPIEAPGGSTVGEEYALFSLVSDAVRLAMADSEAARADAELLALGRQWQLAYAEARDSEAATRAAMEADPEADRAYGKGVLLPRVLPILKGNDATWERAGDLEVQIAAIPAASPAGIAVKLAIAVTHMREWQRRQDEDWNTQVVWSAFDDAERLAKVGGS